MGPLALAAAQGGVQAGINTASGLASAFIQNHFNKKAENRQQERYLQNYAMQRSDALADWNRTNEYNSPAQQMQRLKSAGLSPHLAAGSFSNVSAQTPSTTNASGGSSSSISAHIQPAAFDLLGAKQAFEQIKTQQAQQNLINTQAKNVAADTKVKEVTTDQSILNYNIDVEHKRPMIIAQYRNLMQDVENKKVSEDEAKARINKLYVDTAIARIEEQFRTPLLQGNVKHLSAQIANVLQSTKESKARVERLNLQKKQDRQRFMYELQHLAQKTDMNRLALERGHMQNYYESDFLNFRNRKLDADTKTAEYEYELLNQVDPTTRSFGLFLDNVSDKVLNLKKGSRTTNNYNYRRTQNNINNY